MQSLVQLQSARWQSCYYVKKPFLDAFWKDKSTSTKNVSDYMKHNSYLVAEYLPYINIRAVTFFFFNLCILHIKQ